MILLQPPIIDLSEPSTDTMEALRNACTQWGIFHITGHGIHDTACNDMRQQSQRFFSQAQHAKQSIVRNANNPWGYFDRELTKNRQDWKEIFDVGSDESCAQLSGIEPQWPELSGFQPAAECWMERCHTLATSLLSMIIELIKQNPQLVNDYFCKHHTSFLRLNHYPPCSESTEHLGISEHTDAGALTVLLQDQQPGLQVSYEDEWVTIEPVEQALTVNIGDIVQVWSNDHFKAPLHRVLTNSQQPRYSAAYFLNPSYSLNYQPVESPPKYRPINWGEFRSSRAAGDYADYGEEVQISQYRQ